jgi:predicted permease
MGSAICCHIRCAANLQDLIQVFDGVFCRHPATVNFSTGQRHEPVRVEIVSGSYFPVLGVRPARGRLIDPSDDRLIGGSPVVVISYQFWQTRLGGAPNVIGRRVFLDKYPMTVIGIAPADFTGTDPNAVPALWVPVTMSQHAARIDSGWNRVLDRRAAWMHVFARLKPGMTIETTEAALKPWFNAMLEEEARQEFFVNATPGRRREFLGSTLDLLPAPGGISMLRDLLTRPLWVLLGGSLLLLMLASLNVAGLLLARGAARTRELTTRMAIGATRGRITAQLLVESLLLTLGGGVLGLVAAPFVSQTLLSFMAQDGDVRAQIDHRVLIFAFLASVVTGIVCGLAPVVQTRQIPLMASLKERSRAGSPGGVRARKLLVIGQMAFTLILLIGAGLFVQTVARLHQRVGFASDNLVMVGVNPYGVGYTLEDAERAMREVDRRLRELPMIERAAAANTTMLTGGWTAGLVTIQADSRIVSDRVVARMRVGPGFFATLGTPIVAGRDFDQREVRPPGAAPAPWRTVIVNESFARRYFKDRSPIGARMGFGARTDTVTDIEIIGVVKDFSRRNLRDPEVEQAFVPYWVRDSDDGTFYVRLRGGAEAAFASIRAAIAQVDPALPVTLQTYEDQIDRSLRTERMLATLSSAFGALALLLSIVGLYGVMSFVVTQRTQEIGVRLALGATQSAAVWLVVRDALTMIVAAGMVAIPAAWALRRLVEAQLFGVRAFDAPTIVLATGVLALVALAAAMIPAWRAASVSPTEALRLG